MAEKIDTFTNRHKREAIYPWDEWADGSVWRLTRDEDFRVTVNAMKASAYSEARRRGLKALTGPGPDAATQVEIQFVARKPKDGEEPVQERLAAATEAALAEAAEPNGRPSISIPPASVTPPRSGVRTVAGD